MRAPYAIVRANPPRGKSERPETYALRVLQSAMKEWIEKIYDESRHVVELEMKATKDPVALNALSNVAIEIEGRKQLQLTLIYDV